MQYPEIDERASDLARHLLIFQMQANHQLPALIVGNQARIVSEVAAQLSELCEQHPDAKITIDVRMNEGIETAWRDILGPSTDVPDTPEGLT